MLRTIFLSVMAVFAVIMISSDRVVGKPLIGTAESQNLLSSLLSAMDNQDSSFLKSSSLSSKNSHNNNNNIDSSSDDQIELIVNPIGQQTNEINRVGGDEEKVLSSDDLNTIEIDSMVNIIKFKQLFYEYK